MTDAGSLFCAGRSGEVSVRILHVFDLRDGKIVKENAWWDLADLQRQLGVVVS